MAHETQINHLVFSTDKTRLQVAYIHHFLANESYWARQIPLSVVEKAIENSVCFGVYDGEKQIGFARLITDMATFGYLADVFVDKAYRGRGISKELMGLIMAYEPVRSFRSIMLATLDAHGLYEQFGFKSLKDSTRYMGIKFFESY